jgi:hypothetical protein
MPAPVSRREGQRWPTVSLLFLFLSNVLVFQFGGWFFRGDAIYSNVQVGTSFAENAMPGIVSSSAHNSAHVVGPLDIPEGRAVALPSVRVDDAGADYNRKIYGGKGDKPHLGGFATQSVDPDGMSPQVWKWMVEQIGVKSLLDVRILSHVEDCVFFPLKPTIHLAFRSDVAGEFRQAGSICTE